MWWLIGPGIAAVIFLLACVIWLAYEARVARDEFDASLARYEPRHAVSQPRAARDGDRGDSPFYAGSPVDPWMTILRDPEPAPAADTGTLERLTATGEFRAAVTARTDAWIAEHCPEGES